MSKQLLQGIFRRLGLQISRTSAPNRFQALEDVLARLRAMGFQPDLVVDGGAHIGWWTQIARRYFPSAEFHLIEPQKECQSALQRFAQAESNIFVHECALVEPGRTSVSFHGSGTGGKVANAKTGGGPTVMGITLDELFAGRLDTIQSAFIKLDLEGYESQAIQGGKRVLERTDFLLVETSFYDINSQDLATFGDLLIQVQQLGFTLYDVVSLSERKRDGRLRMGDVLFGRRDSRWLSDINWE